MRLSHLYKRVCPSVGRLVRRSVRRLVRLSVRNAFVKIAKSSGKSCFFLHVYAHTLHVHPFIGLSAHHLVCLSIILSICPSIGL